MRAGPDLTQSPTLTIGGTRDGHDSRDGGLHEPRAGAREAGRQAHRHLGVRLRAVRNADGAAAFEGESVSDILARVIEREPDWKPLPAALPPRVHELLRRCLEKDPKKRRRDIGDVRIEIEQVLSGPAQTAAPLVDGASTGARDSRGSSPRSWRWRSQSPSRRPYFSRARGGARDARRHQHA